MSIHGTRIHKRGWTMTTTVPFTSLDGAVLHLEEELEPWNVQIEVGLKRLVPGLFGATNYRFVDSAVLSNLGRIPDVPALGGNGDETDLWFSPPSVMPLGVGFGVATLEGELRPNISNSSIINT